jgi:hypothetical protein
MTTLRSMRRPAECQDVGMLPPRHLQLSATPGLPSLLIALGLAPSIRKDDIAERDAASRPKRTQRIADRQYGR